MLRHTSVLLNSQELALSDTSPAELKTEEWCTFEIDVMEKSLAISQIFHYCLICIIM